MRRLNLVTLSVIVFASIIIIPGMLGGTVFSEYLYEKECFETKEFLSRAEAEQEYDIWKNALGDKFAGFDFNGLSDKSLSPAPLIVCVFVNQ